VTGMLYFFEPREKEEGRLIRIGGEKYRVRETKKLDGNAVAVELKGLHYCSTTARAPCAKAVR